MRTNPIEFGIMVFAVVLIVIGKLSESVKGSNKRKTKPRKPVSPMGKPGQTVRKAPPTVRARREAENDHDHIRSTALSRDKKLEQLNTLKDAGLLTGEEYAEKLKKVLAKKS